MKKFFTVLKKSLLSILASKNPISRNVVRLKRTYKLRMFQNEEKKVLEICGGKHPLNPKYLNVDILDYPTVDVVTNLHNPLPFETESIDNIVSIATLEHFNIVDSKKILGEFNRVLKTHGIVELGIPSLKKIVSYYHINGCDDMVLRYLHGALKDEYDIHLCIVDFERYKLLLQDVGFTHILEQEYDFPHHDKTMMMKIVAEKV
ncbi:methyltransferase domain-containing protein [Candidatus Uhrbacteria bacterium]|nr:methyltransferase domain-containing protein [Candidatus Uhrbacteria bacterium]